MTGGTFRREGVAGHGLVLLSAAMLARGAASTVCLVVGASTLSWGLLQDRSVRAK